MSLNHLTSSAYENPWMNISCNDLKAVTAEIGSVTLNGPFNITETKSSVINANVGAGVPALICNGTNPTANNFQVGIQCSNSAGRSIKLVSQNAPSTNQNIWCDDDLSLLTFSNPGTIILAPNQTTTLATTQTNTVISTPLSLPVQQYLELNLTAPQSIPNSTTTAVNYNATIKNVGDLTYLSGVVTVFTTGTYVISYYATFASNADNNSRNSLVSVGGVSYAVQNIQNGNGSTTLSSSVPVYIPATTSFSVNVSQSSGGALNLNASRLNIARIA